MRKIFKKVFATALGLTVAFSAAAAPVSAAWSRLSSGQWIYTANGKRSTGWLKVNGSWYYMGQDGIMRTGWQKVGGVWYYLTGSGAMATGWQRVDGRWYYLTSSGAMATGWQQIGGRWYFLNGGGAMVTGWLYNGGKWYFLNSDGSMRTGWAFSGNKWYYMGSSGAMITGWAEISGSTYYFTESGAMATGDVEINGVTYSFGADGAYTGGTLPGNDVAEQILLLVNSVRSAEGLPPLELSQKLNTAAFQRAEERAQMGYLSHYRPDGSHWWTILAENGVSNLDGSAENLAYGMDTPDAAMKAWMESASHKTAILGDNYRYMGVGRYVKDGVTYWAQLFSGSDTAK